MMTKLLGKLSPNTFLREYWQKKPLLIRNAIPHFNSFLTKKNIIDFFISINLKHRMLRTERYMLSLNQLIYENDDE